MIQHILGVWEAIVRELTIYACHTTKFLSIVCVMDSEL